MTPRDQVTLLLTPAQHGRIKDILDKRRKDNPYSRKSDLMREIVLLGLEVLEEDES
jgi:hypothetical protein